MKNIQKLILIFTGIILFNTFVFGQLAGKPSAMNQPKASQPKKPDSSKEFLPKITSQAEFDSIARVYHQGTPYAIPHTMFVIDRRNKNKIYYLNSQIYRFHKDFLYSMKLIPLNSDIYKAAYFADDRRFIVGTIAWQKTVEKWTWELWEGDLAKEDHIKTAHDVINKTFFAPVSYKPNSGRQEDSSAKLNLPKVTQDEINKNQSYLALNTGKAVGRIHIIDKLDDTVEIGDNEILILKELPESLPPVRGIIVSKPSTPLSHINILAKGWNIPNVYIKDADKLFKEYNNLWVELNAELRDYDVKKADKPAILDDFCKQFPEKCPKPREASSNLEVKKLATLAEMKKADSLIYGSKSTNLGEMLNAKIPNIVVPDGFTIPFYWYDKFISDNGLQTIIDTQEDDDKFVHNPRYRKAKLEELQQKILNGKFDEGLRAEIINKWKTQLRGKAVFVRSSSNSEDLPNFSGAGLYDSAMNLVNEEQLINGVKYVWASLWNFRAYEARVRNYVEQTSVYMSALVQIGVDMEKGGVMFTTNPFDLKNKDAVYISVNCGHNDPITANHGMPEQILVNPKTKAVVLMTLSEIRDTLRFDQKSGGLKFDKTPCANPVTKRILSDIEARKLASIALNIRKLFGDQKAQDIEWGMIKGQVHIVQSRPYIAK